MCYLCVGDCGGCALFAGGVGVLEMLEVMHRVLLYMLEAVEGELCLL